MSNFELEEAFREWWAAQGYAAKPNPHTVTIATAWASTLLEQRQGSVKSAPSLTFAATAADGPAVPEGREPASVAKQSASAEGEVAELVAWLKTVGVEAFSGRRWQYQITRAADLLSIAYATGPEVWEPIPLLPAQRHPAPVPVSERLPQAEDCDAEGRCWLHLPDMGTEPLWRLTDPALRSRYHTHWLPANALPLPQGEVK